MKPPMKPTVLAVASLLFCFEGHSQIAVAVAPQTPTSHNVDVLREMAPLVEPCVRPTTTSRVFTRCFDTHSSIHAHWAAYRIARHDPTLTRLAITSQMALQPAKLNYEMTFMRYSYAAAWFLRLAIDYEKWALSVGAGSPFRLRTVGDQMAAWLKSYWDSRGINPYWGEYNNPAWALAQLHDYYTFTRNSKLADQVSATIRRTFVVKINGLTFASDRNLRGFFSVIGNWMYVVAHTQSRATFAQFLRLQTPILDSHLIVNNVTSVHSYGLIWSRMWAFRALGEAAPNPVDRQRFRDAAQRHLTEGMLRHKRYKGNFGAYAHWVPQFAVYAVTAATELDA